MGVEDEGAIIVRRDVLETFESLLSETRLESNELMEHFFGLYNSSVKSLKFKNKDHGKQKTPDKHVEKEVSFWMKRAFADSANQGDNYTDVEHLKDGEGPDQSSQDQVAKSSSPDFSKIKPNNVNVRKVGQENNLAKNEIGGQISKKGGKTSPGKIKFTFPKKTKVNKKGTDITETSVEQEEKHEDVSEKGLLEAPKSRRKSVPQRVVLTIQKKHLTNSSKAGKGDEQWCVSSHQELESPSKKRKAHQTIEIPDADGQGCDNEADPDEETEGLAKKQKLVKLKNNELMGGVTAELSPPDELDEGTLTKTSLPPISNINSSIGDEGDRDGQGLLVNHDKEVMAGLYESGDTSGESSSVNNLDRFQRDLMAAMQIPLTSTPKAPQQSGMDAGQLGLEMGKDQNGKILEQDVAPTKTLRNLLTKPDIDSLIQQFEADGGLLNTDTVSMGNATARSTKMPATYDADIDKSLISFLTKPGSDGIFRCSFCDFITNKNFHLKRHLTIHTGQKFRCTMCEKSYVNKSKLREHIEVKHEGRIPFECGECGKKFTSRQGLVYHQQRSGLHGHCYSCSYCSKTFTKIDEYKAHVTSHAFKPQVFKSFQCSKCPEKFSNQADIDRHFDETHKEVIEPLQCTSCFEEFYTKTDLENHEQNCVVSSSIDGSQDENGYYLYNSYVDDTPKKSGPIENFKCHFCEYETNKSTHLKRHLTIHTGKKYQCSQCDKSYVDKFKLKHHVEVKHEGKVPFECELCGKKFTSRQGLAYHVRRTSTHNHHYSCKVCSQVFQEMDQYKAHVTSHSFITEPGKKTVCFLCPCKLLFSSKEELHAHSLICDFAKTVVPPRDQGISQPIEISCCGLCGEEFADPALLTEHVKNCVKAEAVSESDEDNISEEEDEESDYTPFPITYYFCVICGEDFQSQEAFEEHRESCQ